MNTPNYNLHNKCNNEITSNARMISYLLACIAIVSFVGYMFLSIRRNNDMKGRDALESYEQITSSMSKTEIESIMGKSSEVVNGYHVYICSYINVPDYSSHDMYYLVHVKYNSDDRIVDKFATNTRLMRISKAK